MKNNPLIHKTEQQPPGPNINEVAGQVAEANRRLRLLEDRYKTLHQKMQLTDENMLDSHKKIHKELRANKSEIDELKHTIGKLNENVGLVIAELKKCARTEDIKTLEKYLGYWQPVKFVTQEQVERIVKDMLDK